MGACQNVAVPQKDFDLKDKSTGWQESDDEIVLEVKQKTTGRWQDDLKNKTTRRWQDSFDDLFDPLLEDPDDHVAADLCSRCGPLTIADLERMFHDCRDGAGGDKIHSVPVAPRDGAVGEKIHAVPVAPLACGQTQMPSLFFGACCLS